MSDVRKELREDHSLRHVGWLRAGPCPGRCSYQHEPGHYHAYIDTDIEQFVVYALIIGDQIMKFGKAGSKGGTLRDRMKNTISSGNAAWLFAEGRLNSNAGWTRRPLDKFKREIPGVIRAGQPIEVWAGAFTADTFEAKERELNAKYNPPWVDRIG